MKNINGKAQNNFNETNIEFISKPLGDSKTNRSNKEFTMVQRNSPCKVIPAISAMKKSADYLFE